MSLSHTTLGALCICSAWWRLCVADWSWPLSSSSCFSLDTTRWLARSRSVISSSVSSDLCTAKFKGNRSHLQISLNITKLCKDEKYTIMIMNMKFYS